jgi:hypothetical protein
LLEDAKTNQARTELLKRVPLVRVYGSVEAEIAGTAQVEIQNTPLEVEIVR